MRHMDEEKLLIYAGAVLFFAFLVPVLSRIPRTRGKHVLWHVAYAGSVIVLVGFDVIPEFVQDEIFSPGGVIVLATILPVYESIVAVCSVGEQDDTTWLQFWITSGTLSFSTEFMDEITAVLPQAGEHWYEFEFFFNLWLILPMTDGASLIYDLFTKPYITPTAQKIKNKCEGYIAILLTIVNGGYMWVLWFSFVSLPEDTRRFLTIALGTAYPIAASTVAIATAKDPTSIDGTTYWLTYWSCFSLLFLAMDYLENFVGHIRGFYSIICCMTLYLFLPMFGGAEVIFRRVLVPLSGQYQNMLLHDAYIVKVGMEKKIAPGKQREEVMRKAAELFAKIHEE